MNKYLQSMEHIEYKTLMSEILPSSLKQYLREDVYDYLIEIFTPDMEDKETLSMSLYEWLEYFINTSLELIDDTINYESIDYISVKYMSEVYSLHEKIIRDILNCLHLLLEE